MHFSLHLYRLKGYSGCEVRAAHARTEIIIRATHTQEVLGEKGRRIRELTALVQKRFKFGEGAVELYAEKVGSISVMASMLADEKRLDIRFRTEVFRLLRNASLSDISYWVAWPLDGKAVPARRKGLSLMLRLPLQCMLRCSEIHYGERSQRL